MRGVFSWGAHCDLTSVSLLSPSNSPGSNSTAVIGLGSSEASLRVSAETAARDAWYAETLAPAEGSSTCVMFMTVPVPRATHAQRPHHICIAFASLR
jgi:hypothetical protein